MSRLSAGNGIQCDLCSSTYTDKFTYFNYSLIKTWVSNFPPSMFQLSGNRPDYEYDVCEECDLKLSNLIIKNNKLLKIRECFCELSGEQIKETFAYAVKVASIRVDLTARTTDVDHDRLFFVMGFDKKSLYFK